MSKKLDFNFLAINTDFFKLGLNPTQLLILSKVDELNRNCGDCYITDESLAELFGVSKSTISREIKALDGKGFLIKETKNIKGGKERHMKVNFTNVKMTIDSSEKASQEDTQTSNCLLSNVNLPIVNKQNDFIKENIKENKKENIREMKQPQASVVISLPYQQRSKVETVSEVMKNSTSSNGQFKF